MIQGNVIKFGYGTVAVGSTIFNDLTIQTIKPPQEVGKLLEEEDEVEYIGERVNFSMAKYYHELKEKLQSIDGPCCVTFCGYIFDFTNYNSASVDAVFKHATNAYRNYIRLCAC